MNSPLTKSELLVSHTSQTQPKRGQRSRQTRGAWQRRLLRVEVLEARRVLAAYLVTTLDDVVDGADGEVSLREAIQAANTNLAVNTVPAGDAGPGVVDEISFAASLSGGTITLSGSQLSITDAVSISLGAATSLTIDANALSRVFSVDAGSDSVSISGIEITGGSDETGGGIFVAANQSLSLDSVSLAGNVATGAAATQGGGAIFSDGGTVDIVDSLISGNVASGVAGSGGGILNLGGTLTVTGGQIVGNTANRAGGGIETAGGTVELTNVSLGSDGDGLNDASEGNSVAENSNPGNGGGLHIGGNGVVTIAGSRISANSAIEGGGLWNSGAGTLTVINSTVANNVANDGGGIFQTAGAGTLSISNTTVAGNAANSGQSRGGGIAVLGGTATLASTTISLNSGDGGGVFIENAVVDAVNTVIAANMSEDGSLTLRADAVGPFDSAANVFLRSPFGSTGVVDGENGNVIGQDAMLSDMLTDNGGPTLTLLPLAGSPLINTGDNTLVASGVVTDQRGTGFARIANTTVDIGAVEVQSVSNGPFIVTVLGDGIDLNDGETSLREAIIAANTNPGSDTIQLAAGIYVLTTTGAGEDVAFFGDLDITGDLTIIGTDSATTSIDASALGDRVFEIFAGVTFSISGLTISGGSATGDGGAIANRGGFVTIDDSILSDNTALGDGATITGSGGAIFNGPGGTIVVSNSTFANNVANRAGGSIEDASGVAGVVGVSLTDVDLTGNNAGIAPATSSPGNGGGLHVTGAGDVTITGGNITGNVAAREGGGLWNGTGVMMISGTIISGNTASGDAADDGGGGVFNDGGTLTISGATISNNIADGTAGSGGGILNLGGTMTVTGGQISGNTANRAGGGIETAGGTVALTGVTLGSDGDGTNDDREGNSVAENAAPGNGGGLHIGGSGVVTISGGSVIGNSAIEGGGLWNSPTGSLSVDSTMIADNTAIRGGGVYQEGNDTVPTSAATTLTDSTIARNTASGDLATDGGGGVYNAGSSVTLIGSTITSNTATGTSGSGGGLFSTAGTINATSTSFEFNGANRAGGGIEVVDGIVSLTDSNLISNDVDGTATGGTAAPGNGGGLHVSGMADVTFDGGSAFNNIAASEGGAFWNSAGGTLTIRNNALIFSNTALGDDADNGGGGVFNNGGVVNISGSEIENNFADGENGSGGGIFNATGGTVTVTSSSIINNVASRAGGGIEDASVSGAPIAAISIVLTDVILQGNNAGVQDDGNGGGSLFTSPGNGGGLHVSGAGNVMITGGLVSNNIAAREGGGLWNSSGMMIISGTTIEMNRASGDAADDGGGGIFNNGGHVVVSDATISNNIADGTAGSGGGVLNLGGVLAVSTSLVTANIANRAGGAFEVTDGSSTDLDRLTITNNVAGPEGTAAPGNGGGLHISGAGMVSIRTSTIDANTALKEGGGLWNSGAGSLTVADSTISNNNGGDGGGIFQLAGAGTLIISNTTIAGNTATAIDTPDGGGIALIGGTAALNSVTIAGNTGNGGGVFNGGGTLQASNTVIAGNSANSMGEDGADVLGNFNVATSTFLGNSDGTIGFADGTEGNTVGGDAMLGVLANNGGPTRTMLPLAGSPLINAGNNTLAAGFLYDQRGISFDRVVGTSVDIGAVEVQDVPVGGTIVVTTLTDVVDANDGVTSLREAIILANSTLGMDVISLAAGNYTLTITGDGEDASATGDLDITDAVMITGADAMTTIIDASALGDRVFEIVGAVGVDFGGLTITGGNSAGDGGAIANRGGMLSLINMIIDANTASGDGDMIPGSGGGIFNGAGGILTVTDSTLSNNVANRAGGAIEDASGVARVTGLTLTNVIMSGNNAGVAPATAAPGNGGALHVSGAGDVSISGGSVINNVAAREGGGLWNSIGTMTIDGTLIDGNTASGVAADDGGGGIFNNGGTVNVSGATISNNVADGTAGSGGGILNLGGTVIFMDSQITDNTANRAGGGIEVNGASTTMLDGVMLSNNVVGNAPGNGGGLHTTGAGVVSIINTTVAGNTATNEGGGLWNSDTGTLDVIGSTISGNSSGDGGGIFNDSSSGDVVVTNSTIAGNMATSSGGGIASEGATVTLTSVTIAANTAATGGGVSSLSGIVASINSIIASNTAATGADFAGSLTSNGNNLIGDSAGVTFATSSASDITDVDAGLATLVDNGGPTRTIALLNGSPALGVGVAAGLTTDQRGTARPQGNAIDIGAFESSLNLGPNPATLSIAATNANQSEGNSGATAFTFTVTRGVDTTGTATVDYIVAGTGANPANAMDFVGGALPSGTVTFADGESTAVVTINVAGDTEFEPNETFTVNLGNASGTAQVTGATADGVIRDDDRPIVVSRIFTPSVVVGLQVIPGDSIPTSILFKAFATSTVTIIAIAFASVTETFRIVDENLQTVSTFVGGVASATVQEGGTYAIIFDTQTMDRTFSIASTEGFGSLGKATSNILQLTDTNGDSTTTASDALVIINALGRLSSGEGEQVTASTSYLDVNRDDRISALDALNVINQLTRLANSPPTGELPVVPIAQQDFALMELDNDSDDDVISTLATDSASRLASFDSAESTPSSSGTALDSLDVDSAFQDVAPEDGDLFLGIDSLCEMAT